MLLSREKFIDQFWPAVKVHVIMRGWWTRRIAPPTHCTTTMYECMRTSGAEWSITSRRFSEIVEPIVIELYTADRKRKPDAGLLLERVYAALTEYQAFVSIRPPLKGHSQQIDNLHCITAAGIGVICNACGHRDHVRVGRSNASSARSEET
jgi:hypothetical protein